MRYGGASYRPTSLQCGIVGCCSFMHATGARIGEASYPHGVVWWGCSFISSILREILWGSSISHPAVLLDSFVSPECGGDGGVDFVPVSTVVTVL